MACDKGFQHETSTVTFSTMNGKKFVLSLSNRLIVDAVELNMAEYLKISYASLV